MGQRYQSAAVSSPETEMKNVVPLHVCFSTARENLDCLFTASTTTVIFFLITVTSLKWKKTSELANACKSL